MSKPLELLSGRSPLVVLGKVSFYVCASVLVATLFSGGASGETRDWRNAGNSPHRDRQVGLGNDRQ
jgi:hypothetical protein